MMKGEKITRKRGPKTIGGSGMDGATARAGRELVQCRLAEFRVAAGMSQLRLSLLTGIADSNIGQIEHGQQYPKVERMFLISYVLGVPVTDIWPGLSREAILRKFQGGA